MKEEEINVYLKTLSDRELLESIYKLLLLNTEVGIQTRYEINQDDKELGINTIANLIAGKIGKSIIL